MELPDAARRSCSGVQYLFENPQGTVPSITDQRDKNADNAPACASYLMIRATRGSRILDYRIYLGENNTTDFNVGRNTAHTLDITISGDNEVDTRVHGYTLSVTDDFESNRIGSYCVLPFNASLYVNIERAESEPTLTGALELLTPTDGTLLVDYEECASRLDLPINRQQGSNYYELVYYPKVITEARARLTYEVRVRDSYGYESRSRFEHCFAMRSTSYRPAAVRFQRRVLCTRKRRTAGCCVPPATSGVAPSRRKPTQVIVSRDGTPTKGIANCSASPKRILTCPRRMRRRFIRSS